MTGFDAEAVLSAEPDCEIIEHLPFTTMAGPRARIGLVLLASEYTLEDEIRSLIDRPDLAIHCARIRNSPSITPDTLAAMGPLITDCVDLILPGDKLDVVAFACTSASMVLSEDFVTENILAARPDAAATNPATASFAALRAVGAQRIAVLTPYRRDVNTFVRRRFLEAGFEVPVFGSFNEERDPVVSKIDAESLRAGIERLARGRSLDAVFVSCTSVRLAHVAADIEADLGIPVLSSNLALAWHCLSLAGFDTRISGRGRLFE